MTCIYMLYSIAINFKTTIYMFSKVMVVEFSDIFNKNQANE